MSCTCMTEQDRPCPPKATGPNAQAKRIPARQPCHHMKFRDYTPGGAMERVMITRKPPHCLPKIPGELFFGIPGNKYLFHYLSKIFGNLICDSFGAHSTLKMLYFPSKWALRCHSELLKNSQIALFKEKSALDLPWLAPSKLSKTIGFGGATVSCSPPPKLSKRFSFPRKIALRRHGEPHSSRVFFVCHDVLLKSFRNEN